MNLPLGLAARYLLDVVSDLTLAEKICWERVFLWTERQVLLKDTTREPKLASCS